MSLAPPGLPISGSLGVGVPDSTLGKACKYGLINNAVTGPIALFTEIVADVSPCDWLD